MGMAYLYFGLACHASRVMLEISELKDTGSWIYPPMFETA